MRSRVEKYQYNSEPENCSRYEKNQDIYNNVNINDFSKFKIDNNEKIIERYPKTIDINKIKKYIEDNQEEMIQKKDNIVVNDKKNESKEEIRSENKLYDLNSVLERAKQGRETYYEDEKYKKLRDTQYDILSKIEMYEEPVEKPEFNTEEKTLIDLINTVTISKNNKEPDLLEELKDSTQSNDSLITQPIESEVKDPLISNAIKESQTAQELQIKSIEDSTTHRELTKNLDKSFYTNSMSFSKEDFEGFEELEKSVKKNNVFVKLGIVLLIFLILGTIYIILKFVLKII